MGRIKKIESSDSDIQIVPSLQDVQDVQQAAESEQDTETGQPQKSKEDDVEVPSNILELMRLYPQYSEFWVTPEGFVHPKGIPTRLLKDAILYKNKFYNQ